MSSGSVSLTRIWFEMRASGRNPGSGRLSGVNPRRMILYRMLMAGAVAGLIGMSTMRGQLAAYTQDFARGYGV